MRYCDYRISTPSWYGQDPASPYSPTMGCTMPRSDSKESSGNSKTADRPQVALLVETSKMYGRGILRGVSRYMRIHGAWSTYIEERSLGDDLPPWLDQWKGDGVILRCRDMNTIRAVRKKARPMVLLGEHYLPVVPSVQSPDLDVSRLVYEHFVEKGIRNFAYLGVAGPEWSKGRQQKYVEVVEEAGFSCSVTESQFSRHSNDSYFQHLRELGDWLRSLPKPVGIMCAYDIAALRCIDACRMIGEPVPERIAIVGVDNDDVLCDVADPPLSSVAQDPEQIGFEAARLLDLQMQGCEVGTAPVEVPPLGLVQRASSDTVAVEDEDVAQALRIIRERVNEGINIDDVASSCSISRRTLERKFTKYLGRTPKEEVRRRQIEHVKRLLLETDLSVEDICAVSGFEYASYLHAVFKRVTGSTVGAYRSRAQKGAE